MADTPSSCRAPWFDTMTAGSAFVHSALRVLAVRTPLTRIGPPQTSRIHPKSFQVTCRLLEGSGRRRGRAAASDLAESRWGSASDPRRARSRSAIAVWPGTARGKGASPRRRLAVPASRCARRAPVSLRLGVSIVTTSAEKPAARARAMPARAASCPPTRYS